MIIPDPAPSPYKFFGLASGLAVTYSGVTFTQETVGYFYDLSPSFYPVSGPVLTEEAAGAPTASILITLPSATTGIAFDFGSYSPTGATITLSNGDVTQAADNYSSFNGYNTPNFFGITDTSSFDSVLISNIANYDLTIANVAYAPAEVGATPEPSYRTLLVLMLFGLCLWRGIVVAHRSLP